MKQLAILLLSLALVGCDIKMKDSVPDSNSQVVVTSEIKELSESMKTASEDVLLMWYKQFSGLADYMENAGSQIDNTAEMFRIFDRFKSDYGIDSSKYPKAKEALDTFFINKSYKVVKKITETNRSEIIADVRAAAEAMRLALEQKNAN